MITDPIAWLYAADVGTIVDNVMVFIISFGFDPSISIASFLQSVDRIIDSRSCVIALFLGGVFLFKDSFSIFYSLGQSSIGFFCILVIVVAVAFGFFNSFGQALDTVVNQAGEGFTQVGNRNIVFAGGCIGICLDSFSSFHSFVQSGIGILSEIFGVLGCGFVQSGLQILLILIGGRAVGILSLDELDVVEVQQGAGFQGYVNVSQSSREDSVQIKGFFAIFIPAGAGQAQGCYQWAGGGTGADLERTVTPILLITDGDTGGAVGIGKVYTAEGCCTIAIVAAREGLSTAGIGIVPHAQIIVGEVGIVGFRFDLIKGSSGSIAFQTSNSVFDGLCRIVSLFFGRLRIVIYRLTIFDRCGQNGKRFLGVTCAIYGLCFYQCSGQFSFAVADQCFNGILKCSGSGIDVINAGIGIFHNSLGIFNRFLQSFEGLRSIKTAFNSRRFFNLFLEQILHVACAANEQIVNISGKVQRIRGSAIVILIAKQNVCNGIAGSEFSDITGDKYPFAVLARTCCSWTHGNAILIHCIWTFA
ncbi:hypothetical protein BN3661_01838 [Eubacteriaceae bacterium CHKCI005]|nr:hypothetical protein BN3661_01838 [Eubacteriaceae bacterium CHKCI005]